MFYLMALIAGIWGLSRIADNDYQQALWLLIACGIFGLIGALAKEHD